MNKRLGKRDYSNVAALVFAIAAGLVYASSLPLADHRMWYTFPIAVVVFILCKLIM